MSRRTEKHHNAIEKAPSQFPAWAIRETIQELRAENARLTNELAAANALLRAEASAKHQPRPMTCGHCGEPAAIDAPCANGCDSVAFRVEVGR